VLQDISNLPDRRMKKSSMKSPTQASEVDCREIESPPAFGLFDLGINRDINQRSPLFQELSKVKVILKCNILCVLFIFSHEFNLSDSDFISVFQVEDTDVAGATKVTLYSAFELCCSFMVLSGRSQMRS
jgi:hypothetical protein